MTSLPENAHALVVRWREIQSRGGHLEFDIGEFARDARSVYPAWDKLYEFFSDSLGETHSRRVRKFLEMADAVSLVPDVNVWRAAGWEGVRTIARIESAKKREAACSRIVTKIGKRASKVGRAAVSTILAEVAPEIFVPAPAVPETAKDRQQARMAEAKRADAKAIEQAPRVPDRGDVLAKAIRRLVSGGYAFLADLLTPEERKAAGLPAAKRKASAS